MKAWGYRWGQSPYEMSSLSFPFDAAGLLPVPDACNCPRFRGDDNTIDSRWIGIFDIVLLGGLNLVFIRVHSW